MMDYLDLTCIILWIASLTSAQEGRVERRFACWGSAGPPVVSAQCPRDTVLHIIRAGLKVQANGGRCEFQELDCGCTLEEPGCQMPDVRDMCMGKPACRIDVTQQYIGTGSCHGFSDYMYIEFKCVQVTKDASHDVCQAGNLQHSSGFLKSPNHPDPYPANRHCECALSATEGATIDIQILDLQLKDRDCDSDYLSLEYSGQETMFCGQSNGLRESIATDAREILLSFHTDGQGADNGFWIKYQAQPRSPIKITCVSTIIDAIESSEPEKPNNIDPTPSVEVIWTISTRTIPLDGIDKPETEQPMNLNNDALDNMINQIDKNNTGFRTDEPLIALGVENLPKDLSDDFNASTEESLLKPNDMSYVDDMIISEVNFIEDNPQFEDINIFENNDYTPIIINDNFQSAISPEYGINDIDEALLLIPSEETISNEFIENVQPSSDPRYIEVGDYFYQPNRQETNRRRISRFNLQRFRERIQQEVIRPTPEENIINIERPSIMPSRLPEERYEFAQSSVDDTLTNNRIENSRLDFELFAKDIGIPTDIEQNRIQPTLQDVLTKRNRNEPVNIEIEIKDKPSRPMKSEDHLIQNPKDNLQNEINQKVVPKTKSPTTPWWWQYTAAKKQVLPSSTLSPIMKDRRARLKKVRAKNNGAKLESKESQEKSGGSGQRQGVTKNQNVVSRSKARSNIQGDVMQNVEEHSTEPSRYQTQQQSATVTVVAVGIIALIVLVIVVGIAVRWALNKREAKKAWRKRHRKECALRHHAARQSARR